MSHRDFFGPAEPRHPRSRGAPPSRSSTPVLALQRSLGNRATTQLLARKDEKERGTFETGVRIGKLGPIEVTESNIADWIAKKDDAYDLIATTATGEHSDQLKRLSASRTRIDTIEVQTITGENSWAIVTFKNALIRGYEADASGKTERWKAVGFDAVSIKRTSIGTPRP
jgi:hypothetical protein